MWCLISQRCYRDKYGEICDSLEQSYTVFFEKYGVNLIPVSNITKNSIENYFSTKGSIDGIILSGGDDIELSYFSDVKNNNIKFSREIIESRLLEYAILHKIPVLGVCRGLQFINLYFGGKINSDIKLNAIDKHDEGNRHKISLFGDAKKLLTGNMDCYVNSYHNQGVFKNDLPATLEFFASTDDGVVEGLYHPNLPIAAIQYHPERDKNVEAFSELLLEAFIKRELFWEKK